MAGCRSSDDRQPGTPIMSDGPLSKNPHAIYHEVKRVGLVYLCIIASGGNILIIMWMLMKLHYLGILVGSQC